MVFAHYLWTIKTFLDLVIYSEISVVVYHFADFRVKDKKNADLLSVAFVGLIVVMRDSSDIFLQFGLK